MEHKKLTGCLFSFRSPAKRQNKVASLQSLAKDNLSCRQDLSTSLGNCLEKSKSDSRLNNTSVRNADRDSALSMVTDDNEHEDADAMKRSVSQMVIPSGKKSPKKATKKSKSYSKLGEVDQDLNSCSSAGHLSVVAPTPPPPPAPSKGTEMKLMKRLKKSPMARLKNSRKNQKEEVLVVEMTEEGDRCSAELQEISISHSATNEGADLDGYEDDEEDTSLESDILPVTSLQEYSILEQCIKQYETFYQVFVSRQLFNLLDGRRTKEEQEKQGDGTEEKEEDGEGVLDEFSAGSLYQLKDHVVVDNQRANQQRMQQIDQIFDTLLVEKRESQRELNKLLEESIFSNRDEQLRIVERSDVDEELALGEKQDPKLVKRLMELKLFETLRSALKLASNLLVELSTFPNYNQQGVATGDHDLDTLPHWLRVLAIGSCYLRNDKEIQLNCISTLFELVSLLQAQFEPQTLANPGVTYVVMLPLLRVSHIRVMERDTRVFQLLTSVLWDYLADDTVDRFQVTSLLYQLHASLERSGTVEMVIGHRLTNTHNHWQFECERREDDDDDEDEGDDEGVEEESGSEWETDGRARSRGQRRITDFRGRLDRYSGRRMEGVKMLCPVPVPSLLTCNDYLDESETAAFRKFELLWHLGRDRMTKGFDKVLMQVS